MKKNKKNRRTLRKRIFYVVSLCILITIILYASIVIFLTISLTSGQAFLLAQFYSYNIAREMNSDNFLERMGIDNLENINTESQQVKEWLDSINLNKDLLNIIEEEKISENGVFNISINKDDNGTTIGLSIGNNPHVDLFITHIEILDKDIYVGNTYESSLVESLDGKRPIGSLFKKFQEHYSFPEAKSPLYNSSGMNIGNVKTSINPDIVYIFFIILTIPVIIAGIVCLVIALFLSKILTLPISRPLCQLDQKMEAIAREDYNSGKDLKVELKRPLREVESIANSTNKIIKNMKHSSELLEEKNKKLENQNSKLETQNEEIEAQKEEIEAQHEALIESKNILEETQTQLIQSEKMAYIGQLTAAITHEINTPLGAINSNVQMLDMLLKNAKSNEELSNSTSTLIEQMIESNNISIMACKRVKEIISSLKQFSSLDQAEYQEKDLKDCLKSVIVLTSNLWKNKIKIHENYEDLSAVMCFPGLLNQVFMNIIVNSIHAIEKSGNIYIKTKKEGNNAIITIEDDGDGIPEEVIPKIFDYGFTTKKDGKGMGIGLAISKNIIDKHNGKIIVKSKKNNGTKFIISIPF
ncbi:MAG: ATP-binding protein [Halanaerobiales bacterium]